MVCTDVRFVPPTIRCDAVLNGTIAWSSRLLVESEPADVSTPTTSYGTLLSVTVCPTGSIGPNSSLAVSEASTVTAAALAWSDSLMKRPDSRLRPRTGSQDDVVPTTVVVQFVEPLSSSWELCRTGATPLTSGAAVLDVNAVASAMVSVDAEPKPPRTPPLVELPGETISRLPPSAANCLATFCCAPWPSPTVSTTAAMPIRMPSEVSIERSLCVRIASQPLPKTSDQVIGDRPRPQAGPRLSRRRGCGRPDRPARRPRPRA